MESRWKVGVAAPDRCKSTLPASPSHYARSMKLGLELAAGRTEYGVLELRGAVSTTRATYRVHLLWAPVPMPPRAGRVQHYGANTGRIVTRGRATTIADRIDSRRSAILERRAAMT
jgi:hypothetical protein